MHLKWRFIEIPVLPPHWSLTYSGGSFNLLFLYSLFRNVPLYIRLCPLLDLTINKLWIHIEVKYIFLCNKARSKLQNEGYPYQASCISFDWNDQIKFDQCPNPELDWARMVRVHKLNLLDHAVFQPFGGMSQAKIFKSEHLRWRSLDMVLHLRQAMGDSPWKEASSW